MRKPKSPAIRKRKGCPANRQCRKCAAVSSQPNINSAGQTGREKSRPVVFLSGVRAPEVFQQASSADDIVRAEVSVPIQPRIGRQLAMIPGSQLTQASHMLFDSCFHFL